MAAGDGSDNDAMAETALVVAPRAGQTDEEDDSRLTPILRGDQDDGLEPGKRLGRYVVVKRIGRGGMGTVYAACDPELDRSLALKLVSARGASQDGEQGRTRLLREAQAIASLSHPNVVAVHDVGIWEDYVVIAMEFIEGQSLREWSRTKPGWREVVEIYSDAGRGLDAAHRAGLVHRDFKPDNVLMGSDGRVLVVDFGLARPSGEPAGDVAGPPPALEPMTEANPGSETDPKLTRTGTTLGTPAYMSPEQHRCEPIDARSDQFSFCVGLWEALYGQRPFSGRTLGELARQTSAREIAPPRSTRGVPSVLRRALVRGLSPEPRDRFPSMQELVAAVRVPLVRRRVGRMVAWAGLVAGAVAVAVAVMPAASRTRGPRCEASSAEAKLAGVWDDDLRARVEAAVLATGREYAPDTWERIETALDEHATRWVVAHVEACAATHLRGEHPASWLDERMRCLDRRLEEVGELTTKLAGAGDDLVTVAGLRVRELPPVSSCERGELQPAKPQPEPGPLRRGVQTQRERLETARDMVQAKNAEAGRDLVKAVLDRGRELSYPPLEAEALIELGKLDEELDHDYVRATTRFQRAVTIALKSEYAGAAARGWVALTQNATSREQFDEAQMWAGYAGSLLRRYPDPAVEQDLEAARTWLAIHQGDIEMALAHAQRALELEEASAGPDHPRAIAALNLVSVAYYYGHRKDEALEYLYRALAIAEAVHGPKHPALSASLNNIGVILTDQKKYDEAVLYYERSLAIREATLDERHAHLHQAYDNLAELLYRDGQLERALEYALRAVELARAADVGADAEIKAIHRVGVLYLEQGNVVAAEPHIRRALALWDALPELKRGKFMNARYRFTVASLDWELGTERRQAREVARAALADLESGGQWHADDAERVRSWLERHR